MSFTSPLLIPELLEIVFDHLDPPSLSTACRVSHLWFDVGIDVLWREPPVSALAAIDQQRRSLYAKKVLNLQFQPDQTVHHEAFKGLEFAQLRILSDRYSGLSTGPLCIDQYVQPNLREFTSSLGPVTEEFFDRLFSNCPYLHLLDIGTPVKHFNGDAFFMSMRKCRALKTLILDRHMIKYMTSEGLTQIASQPNLENLTLNWPLESGIIDKVFAGSPLAFQRLAKLDIRIESCDVHNLVQGIKHIRELSLTIVDDDEDVFRHIATLSELRNLWINHSRGTRYRQPELRELQVLGKLQSLKLGPPIRMYFEDAADFDDGFFVDFISHFPDLRELCMLVSCYITSAGLRSMAKSCPKIRSIQLLGSFDMNSLDEAPSPVFPALQIIELGAFTEPPGIGNDKASAVSKLTESLRYHMPNVYNMHTTDDNKFSRAVVSEFQGLDIDECEAQLDLPGSPGLQSVNSD